MKTETQLVLPFLISLRLKREPRLYWLSVETGDQKMIPSKRETILFIMATSLALAFTALALFILLVLLLNLALPSFVSWLMQERYQTCQVVLKPVACESKVMTLQLPQASSVTLMSQAVYSKTTFCHYHIKNPHKSSIACLAQSLTKGADLPVQQT